MDEFLQQLGIKDFDELTSVERETYLKMLDIEQASQISLEDWKKAIKSMRQAVEFELVKTEMYTYSFIFRRVNPHFVDLKARLQNLLLFESFFEKPERAKALLEQYKKRIR